MRLAAQQRDAGIAALIHRTTPAASFTSRCRSYLESCSGNLDCFDGVSVADAQAFCCSSALCAGFSYAPTDQSGCYKLDTQCGRVNASSYDGCTSALAT